MSNFSQNNETDVLEQVIIGRHDTYCSEPAYIERVNTAQKERLPSYHRIEKEIDTFHKTLELEGIEVLLPDPVGKFVYDQLTPRDIGVTIGQKFLLCNMTHKSRRYECAGIFKHIDKKSDIEPEILIPDAPHVFIEGGDIIVDKKKIFVGLTERTNQAGFEYLQKAFKNEFEVIPIEVKSKEEGEDILHLDCMFNPVGKNHALIYEEGFKNIPVAIHNSYNLIPITQQEQRELVLNVLSLSQTKVINRKHAKAERVNSLLRDRGIEVIELPFEAVVSTGGSFRCSSLPLRRKQPKQ
ncbi:MAG: dimethylarginine dimethylaminohydrolase family protein [Bacteroidales bacterium]